LMHSIKHLILRKAIKCTSHQRIELEFGKFISNVK
jgi:hypothetical protein